MARGSRVSHHPRAWLETQESNSKKNCIQMSEASAILLKEQSSPTDFILRCRGPIAVKGKGTMVTYWLSYPGCPDPETLDEHTKG